MSERNEGNFHVKKDLQEVLDFTEGSSFLFSGLIPLPSFAKA